MSETKWTDLYFVDDQGRVFSVGSNWRGYGKRELTASPNKHGYLKVRLSVSGIRKGYLVHKLVAAVYLPPRPSDKHEIRHLDGNKLNNAACNLAWGTRSENAQDRVKHGTQSWPDWKDPIVRAKMIAGMRSCSRSIVAKANARSRHE